MRTSPRKRAISAGLAVVLWQEFQCDLLLELEVVCAIDLAHAAAAEQAEDAVALADDDAHGKSSVLRGRVCLNVDATPGIRLTPDTTRVGVVFGFSSWTFDFGSWWRRDDGAGGDIGAAGCAEAALGGDTVAARKAACRHLQLASEPRDARQRRDEFNARACGRYLKTVRIRSTPELICRGQVLTRSPRHWGVQRSNASDLASSTRLRRLTTAPLRALPE